MEVASKLPMKYILTLYMVEKFTTSQIYLYARMAQIIFF